MKLPISGSGLALWNEAGTTRGLVPGELERGLDKGFWNENEAWISWDLDKVIWNEAWISWNENEAWISWNEPWIRLSGTRLG